MLKKSEIENIRAELLRNVGKNIQHIREEKGISQSQLTSKIIGDFNVTNVSRIETGNNNPTLFTLFRIAKALDVTLPQLLDIDAIKK